MPSEAPGYGNIRLYDASMSGWSFDPSRPPEVGRGRLDAVGQWASDFRGRVTVADQQVTTEPDDAAIGAAYARLVAGLEQLGPGSTATRLEVLRRLVPQLPPAPRIADMGCGAGVATLDLAAALPTAQITAIDTHAGFLEALRAKAATSASITTLEADMAAPPLAPASLDLVWCESAIYGVGRKVALAA